MKTVRRFRVESFETVANAPGGEVAHLVGLDAYEPRFYSFTLPTSDLPRTRTLVEGSVYEITI